MLIVDVNALQTVDLLNFLDEVVLGVVAAAYAEDVVRVDAALGEGIALLYLIAGLDADVRVEDDGIDADLEVVLFPADDLDVRLALLFVDFDFAADLGDDREALRLSRLEELFDSRKTLGDVVAAGDTAGVEGSHCKLCAGLADRLRGDDADRFADVDFLVVGKAESVALGAYAVLRLAGDDGADLRFRDARVDDGLRFLVAHKRVSGNDDFAGLGVADIFGGESAVKTLLKALDVLDLGDEDSVFSVVVGIGGLPAVVLADDNVLRNVDESSGKVSGVRGTERRIGKSLSRASGGDEVFEDVESFTEVRLDRDFDGLLRSVGHQSAHTGELSDLVDASARAGIRHHLDGVVLVEVFAQRRGDVLRRLVPGRNGHSVALLVGDKTALELLDDLVDLLLGFGYDLLLLGRNGHIRDGNGDGASGGEAVAQRLDAVEDFGGLGGAVDLYALLDDLTELLLAADEGDLEVERVSGIASVDEAEVLRDAFVEDDPAGGRVDDAGADFAVNLLGNAHSDGGVEGDDARFVSHDDFVRVAEDLALAGLAVLLHGQIVGAEDHILSRNGDGLAVLRLEQVVRREHKEAGFRLRLRGKRHVNSHLVAVEVGVERGADQRMELERSALDEDGLKRLDSESVQRRRAVEQNGVFLDDGLEGVPDLVLAAVDHLAGVLYIIGKLRFDKALHNEGLEKLDRHLLGQTALVDLQLRSDDYDGTSGIVDALAQQVLSEASLLTLEHIGKRLQRAVVRAGDRSAAPAVVDKGVNGFLKHTLLVSDDDVGSVQLEQSLQTVVSVDDSSVKVVEVAGGETAAVELDHGSDLRRDDREHVENHPLGLVAGLAEGLKDLKALEDPRLLLTGGGFELFLQLFAGLLDVDLAEQLLDRFRAHTRFEVAFISFAQVGVFLLGKYLLVLDAVDVALVGDDVGGEVKHLLQRLRRDVDDEAYAGGYSLEIPDVRYRAGKLDMSHSLAADLGGRDLDSALFADLALVADALILSAVAFPVLGGSEDALAEKAVLLGLERSVVDGFRLLDLALRPASDGFGGRKTDFYCIENCII